MSTDRTSVSWVRVALALGGVLLAATVILLWLDRSLWGAAEGPGLWTSSPRGSLTSQLLFDPYALAHVNHGLLFFFLFAVVASRQSVERRFTFAIMLEAGWEILENTPFVIARFREGTAATQYTGDSILNSLGDILAAVLGFAVAAQVAARLSRRWVLAVFLLGEVISALWIRDSMLLTTILLLYPVPGLREWQAAG